MLGTRRVRCGGFRFRRTCMWVGFWILRSRRRVFGCGEGGGGGGLRCGLRRVWDVIGLIAVGDVCDAGW